MIFIGERPLENFTIPGDFEGEVSSCMLVVR
jgi:hypothetical protein